MQHPFDPTVEDVHAKQFSTLADFFDEPQTKDLCQRFSMLVALCEEKANLLRELNHLPLFRADDAKSLTKKLTGPRPVQLPQSGYSGDN